VLLSGPVWRFVAAVSIGRGVRYFGGGVLAVRYGDQVLDALRTHGPTITAVVLVVVVLGISGWLLWRRAQA